MSYLRRLLGLCEHYWFDVQPWAKRRVADDCIVRVGMQQRCAKCGDYRTVWH